MISMYLFWSSQSPLWAGNEAMAAKSLFQKSFTRATASSREKLWNSTRHSSTTVQYSAASVGVTDEPCGAASYSDGMFSDLFQPFCHLWNHRLQQCHELAAYALSGFQHFDMVERLR